MPVHYHVDGRIAEIVIEGIGPYNLFSPDEVYNPIVEALERFRDDVDVWCALVSAPQDKEVFTYGGHLKSVNELKNAGVDESRGYRFASSQDSLFTPNKPSDTVRKWGHVLRPDGLKIYKPVVFAVHGPCYGAGTLLVNATADYVVASDTARFGLLEHRWAVGVGALGVAVRTTLPWRIAMDMILRGRQMPADEALRYGFVNAVVPRESVLAEARVIAEDFASMPPLAVQAAKRMATLARDGSSDAMLKLIGELYSALLGNGDDAKEGVRAFVEKRKPAYTGKFG